MLPDIEKISKNITKTILQIKNHPDFEQKTYGLIRSVLLLYGDQVADEMRTHASLTAKYFCDSSAADSTNPKVTESYSFASDCISDDIADSALPTDILADKRY